MDGAGLGRCGAPNLAANESTRSRSVRRLRSGPWSSNGSMRPRSRRCVPKPTSAAPSMATRSSERRAHTRRRCLGRCLPPPRSTRTRCARWRRARRRTRSMRFRLSARGSSSSITRLWKRPLARPSMPRRRATHASARRPFSRHNKPQLSWAEASLAQLSSRSQLAEYSAAQTQLTEQLEVHRDRRRSSCAWSTPKRAPSAPSSTLSFVM